MTAWPLNCAAAHAAESVWWRRAGAPRHPLLIDSPAVPLRFEPDAALAPEQGAAAPAVAPAPIEAAQLFCVRP